MKPTCSIVIRSYNEEKHIARLLTGISQQTIRDVQIILVDSGSTDATVEIASRFPVEVISIRPEDFTFGRSLNVGVSHARADFVVIASAHVYPVYPDWLEHLLSPLTDSQVALTYGKQRAQKPQNIPNIKFSVIGSRSILNCASHILFATMPMRRSVARFGNCTLTMKRCRH